MRQMNVEARWVQSSKGLIHAFALRMVCQVTNPWRSQSELAGGSLKNGLKDLK